MVYGLPMPETWERAERGEIVLGGCLVGPIGGVCPHCHWPCQWTDWNNTWKRKATGPRLSVPYCPLTHELRGLGDSTA
jgi:hypothetical protein